MLLPQTCYISVDIISYSRTIQQEIERIKKDKEAESRNSATGNSVKTPKKGAR